MEFSELSFAIPIVLVAYFVRGIAGFGSALIAVPMMCLRLPLEITVPVIIVFDYLGSLTQGREHRQHIVWSEVALLIPFAALGVGSALFLLQSISTDSLMRALGLFIIAYSLYQLLPITHRQGSRILSAPAGTIAGLAGTLFGTGGPFYVTYLTLRKLSKAEFRATFATLFLIDGSIRIAGLAMSGYYNQETFSAILMLLPFAAMGLLLGNQLHLNIGARTFKTLISLLLLATSVPLLMR